MQDNLKKDKRFKSILAIVEQLYHLQHLMAISVEDKKPAVVCFNTQAKRRYRNIYLALLRQLKVDLDQLLGIDEINL